MQTDALIGELQLQGELLSTAARQVDLQAPVPSCPGWTVAAAVGHTAKVHRWATSILRGGDPDNFSYERPDLAMLLAEFDSGLAELVTALRRAPENLAVHTLWPSRSARQFWARRQAHETAIHRIDVELATGYGVSDCETEFAADGIDELVMHLAVDQFRGNAGEHSGTMVITPLDANISWTARLGPSGLLVQRDSVAAADLSVFGLAADLYRWVWNRGDESEVSLRGDFALADQWHEAVTIGSRPDRA